MADLLREQLSADVIIERGGFGEFTVLAGEQVITQRTTIALPKEEDILEAVRSYLQR